ncbi:MerR family transcriptional regulator [Leptospira sarikeiensis]|uniref:MerR family transcriptional regulator n=1 Tax=Leptospira sarikeiensis TaxID=2484943 RepID=A0A4R9K5L7_9LEPT|nr:MerR family transcriptional regulator [Leptospira sarikeiensis]TGL60491.1 MerR family transcriptional regulator [Leptospira sarikeiensis]
MSTFLSISEISEITNFSPYTLRYYEKIGILRKPERAHGKDRKYSEKEIRHLKGIKTLKEMNMSLDDIKEFFLEGCILDKVESGENFKPPLNKRIRILETHLQKLEQKKKDLESMIRLAKSKLKEYETLLKTE